MTYWEGVVYWEGRGLAQGGVANLLGFLLAVLLLPPLLLLFLFRCCFWGLLTARLLPFRLCGGGRVD